MHSELEGARTFTYKVVGDIKIEIDVFEPTSRTATAFSEGKGECKEQDVRVLLFIHGGAWIGGSRHGYSRLLLSDFLQRGYHVASADYRLLSESKFVDEQLEDIRDIEPWLRYTLPGILGSKREISEISVAGVSAGALLALLTPKLWKQNPVAILSLYGPTDLHSISYLNKGLISTLDIPEPDFNVLRTILDFKTPPTQIPPVKTREEWLTPRNMLGMYMFRSSTTAAFLLRGLCSSKVSNSATPELRYPSSGDVSRPEVDAISPLYLASKIKYPPIYQILGMEDDLFDTSHVTRFAQALDAQGTAHAEVLVPGAGHAFDMLAAADGHVHLEVLRPAVEWLVDHDQCRVT